MDEFPFAFVNLSNKDKIKKPKKKEPIKKKNNFMRIKAF